MLLASSNRALSFDQRGHLFAVVRGFDQGADDAASLPLVRYSVLLNRIDLGIAGGLLNKSTTEEMTRRGVEQEVLFADGVEMRSGGSRAAGERG